MYLEANSVSDTSGNFNTQAGGKQWLTCLTCLCEWVAEWGQSGMVKKSNIKATRNKT